MKKETMTSRQRVIAAVRHQSVDRVPIDLGMHFSTGISAFAYHNLRKELGLSVDNIEVPDLSQLLARVDVDVLERFQCDCILLNPSYREPYRWNARDGASFLIPGQARPYVNEKGETIFEKDGRRARMPEGGFFFDGDFPHYPNPYYREDMVKRAEMIYKETNYYTAYMQLTAFFDSSMDGLCEMLTDPDLVIEKNQKRLSDALEQARWVIDNMGQYIQCICLNSDLGMQNAPYCRPSVYDELCAPFVKMLCDFIHQNSDFSIFLHSCGSMEPHIQTLIDSGIDILNPVQISAANMDAHMLKEKYGDKITFWGGGCNTQYVLGVSPPEQVAQNVRELMAAFKPNSGFVFNQVHNIMGNVTPANIIAMLDTAYEESFY